MKMTLIENMKFFKANAYQERCRQKFEVYKGKINKLLPNARVEHIGASSIPGAISKGDIDIFVGVPQPDLEESASILQKLNFQEKEGTLRTNELCMLESFNDDIAIQVVANDSEFEFFLKFRDMLINNYDLLRQYNELKISCTGLSRNQYREKKSTFIEKLLKKA